MIAYAAVLFVLMGIYMYSQADAQTQSNTFFAKVDLPPGAVLTAADIEKREGFVLDEEKDKLLSVEKVEDLIGKQVSIYGIRKGRPVLVNDIQEQNKQFYEIKLVGDITIPETAKLVTVNMIYDEKRYPDRKTKVLAENVPVKEVYNNQNVPIDMENEKVQKVPRAISIWVDEYQKKEILAEKNNGEFYFTTIP